MANKFEMGSSEYTIPEPAKKHYTDAELEQKMDMYSANDYEEGIAPDQYDSSKVNADKETLEEMRKMREKLDKQNQIRGKGVLNFIRTLAS